MKSYLKIIVGIACFGIALNIHAQKYRNGKMEFGLAFGASTYYGDLAQEYFNPNSIGPMAGIFSRFSLSPYFEWRNQFSFTELSADDQKSDFYQNRNLNFETNIWEFTSTFEFNFLSYGINKKNNELDFTSYVFLGAGAYWFNPKATYNGETIQLRDLGTENQSYSLIQPVIPFGMGVKLAFTDRFEIGFEVGYRRLFTDYLDDVSGNYPNFAQLENDRGLAAAQASHAHTYNGSLPAEPNSSRGDNHLTDAYLFSNFTLTYRIVKQDPCP